METRNDAGETDLQLLLRHMEPSLLAEEYVFCVLPDGRYGDGGELDPFATVQEAEGLTLILRREAAERGRLAYPSVCRCISLGVHSSLEAVGLTAAFSSALAQAGISANVIAGYHHDHLFVPADRADEALQVLQNLRG